MSTPGSFSSYSFLELSRGRALAVLCGAGALLVGGIFVDIYTDLAYQEASLWSALLENAIVAILALSLPYLGWRFYRKDKSHLHLSESTTWCLIGGTTTALLGGFAVGMQVFLGDIEPFHLVLHLTAIGALGGLFVGRAFASVRKSERQLLKQEVRLRALYEESPDMVNLHDLEGNLLDPNPSLLEKTGYTKEDLTDMKVWDLDRVLEEDEAYRLWDSMGVGDRERIEGRYQRKDGSSFPVEVHIRRLALDGKDRFMAISRDVTDRRHRERELRKAKKQAQEAAQLKSAMLANMSHEIRTPLTSITGFSQVLEESLDGDLEGFASKIHRSSHRLEQTLESVLHLSRLEAEVEDLQREEVSLRQVAKEVTGMLQGQAGEKSISLAVEAPDTPVIGHWNEDAVRRICRNLVGNAIKYTPEGGEVMVRINADEKWAMLEVDDTGIGMDPENVADLFKAFHQESKGRNREYEGTGLGLSIVNQLVEEVRGTIDVETEKGEGSCFTVRLPLNASSADG